MKKIFSIFLWSLLCISTTASQRSYNNSIIPVERLLYGDSEIDTSHENDLSFSLWHLPEGTLQLLGPGSVKHGIQCFMVNYSSDRLSADYSMQLRLPDFYLVKTRVGYEIPINPRYSIKGGIGCVLGDDPAINPYPVKGISTLIFGFLQGQYHYKKFNFIAEYQYSWFHRRELTIVNAQSYTHEVHEAMGRLHAWGTGIETDHHLQWYGKLFSKTYTGSLQGFEFEVEILKLVVKKHLYIGGMMEFVMNTHNHHHISYGLGAKWIL